jgi:KipI family sensor histidine kinase inhibitor
MRRADRAAQKTPTGRRIIPLGDGAVLIECEPRPGTDSSMSVRDLGEAVRTRAWPFVLDLVPAFGTLCIHYDPLQLVAAGLTTDGWMAALAGLPAVSAAATASHLHRLPICYEEDCGPDLGPTARTLGLSEEAVVRLHAGVLYRVAMIGFAPGFPYLEGLPGALCLPRRDCPRAAVPAGSVAIAEDLCGIYPARLPGGWQVLGRTPVRLFDPARTFPSLLSAGDQVQFVPIGRADFEALCRT